MELYIIIILYCVGLVLMIAEAMMPGVVIGLVGMGALVISIVYGFGHSSFLGIGQIIVAVVFVPSVFYIGFRRLTLKKSLDVKDGAISFAQDYSILVGKTGRSLTPLRPAGIVFIDGRKYDVVTEGEMIDKDTDVKVIRVEGNKVLVKSA